MSAEIPAERKLPGFGVGKTAALASAFAFTGMLVVWVGSKIDLHFLPVLMLLPAIIIGWRLIKNRRCPECGASLILRIDTLDECTGRYRVLYDCSKCRVVWNPGIRGTYSDAS